jgi:hypothetical protein
MSFRARLALVAAAAVGLAVVVASAVVFVVVRDQLRSQADATLQSRADEIRHAPIRPNRTEWDVSRRPRSSRPCISRW